MLQVESDSQLHPPSSVLGKMERKEFFICSWMKTRQQKSWKKSQTSRKKFNPLVIILPPQISELIICWFFRSSPPWVMVLGVLLLGTTVRFYSQLVLFPDFFFPCSFLSGMYQQKGIFTPAGTPRNIRDFLHRDISKWICKLNLNKVLNKKIGHCFLWNLTGEKLKNWLRKDVSGFKSL